MRLRHPPIFVVVVVHLADAGRPRLHLQFCRARIRVICSCVLSTIAQSVIEALGAVTFTCQQSMRGLIPSLRLLLPVSHSLTSGLVHCRRTTILVLQTLLQAARRVSTVQKSRVLLAVHRPLLLVSRAVEPVTPPPWASIQRLPFQRGDPTSPLVRGFLQVATANSFVKSQGLSLLSGARPLNG